MDILLLSSGSKTREPKLRTFEFQQNKTCYCRDATRLTGKRHTKTNNASNQRWLPVRGRGADGRLDDLVDTVVDFLFPARLGLGSVEEP